MAKKQCKFAIERYEVIVIAPGETGYGWKRNKEISFNSGRDAQGFAKAYGRRGSYRIVNVCNDKVVSKFRKRT